MPSIKKIVTGKMNSDASNDLLPQEDFRDGLNVNVGSDGVVSVRGFRKFSESYLASGYWCAGSYHDKVRQRVYAFLAHENQQHRFVVFHTDVEAAVTIWENITDSAGVDILEWDMPAEFDPAKAVKSIRVVHRDFDGDIVLFIDPNGIPLKFNFEKLAGGSYGDAPVLQMFKVISYPPATPAFAYYADDATRSVNNLKKKLFQFRYRYVYLDDEKSVWSAYSTIPLPPKNNDEDYYADGTKANVLKVSVGTGIKTVKKIEIAARVNVNSNWSDLFLIDTLDKASLELQDEITYEYSFYNDGAYNSVDAEEANLLFDYVPDRANAAVLANGNVDVYAGITEGLDREVKMDVSATVTSELPEVERARYQLIENPATYFTVRLIGEAEEDDVFNLIFFLDSTGVISETVSVTHTATAGQTLEDVLDVFVNYINANYGTYLFASRTGDTLRVDTLDPDPGVDYFVTFIDIDITFASPADTTDSVSCLKWKGRYRYGIAYYRNDGKTRGVYVPEDDSWTVDMPAYSEDTGDPRVPSVELSINHTPPSWADYYHIVVTKELTSRKSFFIETGGCDDDTDFGYLRIENLNTHIADFPSTAQTLKYTFAEGDRVRILAKTFGSGAAVLPSYEFEILGVVERSGADFIKIKKSSTYTPAFTTDTDRFLIEIYSPAPVLNEELNVYYEIGKRYPIYTDVNSFRSHFGNKQNQVQGTAAQPAKIAMTEGDYYVRNRNLTVGASGTIVAQTIMDANFSDFWQSAVWSQGRPLVIDDNIKKQYYPGLFRHSLQYIQGTYVNGLNRFYPENFEEADPAYGDVLNLFVRENMIRVFQRFKVGAMPVLRSILIDNAGTTNVALSDRILNKINYYAGDYGIDKYGLSLVSTDFGDYFLDDINRALVRVSLNGVTNISDTFTMRDYFNAKINVGFTAFGTFDYERRDVVMTLVNNDNEGVSTVRFSERNKGFQPRISLETAQGLLFVNGFIWAFRGVPYVQDSESRCVFFGVEIAPFITLVFNNGTDFKKSFTNISMVSNRKWGCTSITTSTGQTSHLKIEDFKQREDGYHAAFLRDSSSPKGLLGGDPLKGNWIEVKLEGGENGSLFTTPSVTEEYEVTLVSVSFNESNLNKR